MLRGTKQRFLVAGGLIVVAACGLIAWLFADAPPVAPPMAVQSRSVPVEPPDENDLDGLPGEVEAVRRDLAGLRSEHDSLRRMVESVMASRVDATGATPALALTQAKEEQEEQVNLEDLEKQETTFMADLDLRLAAEVREPEWSPQTETELGALIDREPETDVISIECAATLCRAELIHRTVESQERVIEQILASAAASGGSFVKPMTGEDDSTRRTIVYLAREGDALDSPS